MVDPSLSFHCIVCYETFDRDERYPVVLPCGHTYICVVCADRVDKCMECRTSLFYQVEAGPGDSSSVDGCGDTGTSSSTLARAQSNSSRNVGRRLPSYIQRRLDEEERARKRQQQLARLPRKRLPLPKNLVLLSLMEVTTLEGGVSATGGSADEDESARILEGVNMATGGCGTYTVAAKGGLLVTLEKSISADSNKKQRGASDWKDLVFGADSDGPKYSVSSKLSLESMCSGEGSKLVRTTPEDRWHYPLKLSFGERVQVVEVEDDGWARLARGRGYVRVGRGSDLVKVGGPKDRACLVEGMIKSLVERWAALKRDGSQLERILVELKDELKGALLEDDGTFTSAASVAAEEESKKSIPSQGAKNEAEANPSHQTPSRNSTRSFPPCRRSPSDGMAGRIPLNHSPTYSVRSSGEQQHPGGVDFRTGMSGHMALTSSKAQQHDHPYRSPINFMSVHTGLNMAKRRVGWSVSDAVRYFSGGESSSEAQTDATREENETGETNTVRHRETLDVENGNFSQQFSPPALTRKKSDAYSSASYTPRGSVPLNRLDNVNILPGHNKIETYP